MSGSVSPDSESSEELPVQVEGRGVEDAEQSEDARDALEGVAKHLDEGVAAVLRHAVEGPTGEHAVHGVVVEVVSVFSL